MCIPEMWEQMSLWNMLVPLGAVRSSQGEKTFDAPLSSGIDRVNEIWGVKKAESESSLLFPKPQGTGVIAHPDPNEASAFRTWRSRLVLFMQYRFCHYQYVSTVLPCYLSLFYFPLHLLFLHLISPLLPTSLQRHDCAHFPQPQTGPTSPTPAVHFSFLLCATPHHPLAQTQTFWGQGWSFYWMLARECLKSQRTKNQISSKQLDACSRGRATVKSEAIKRLKQRGWLEVGLDLCNPFSYNNNGNDDGGLYCMSLHGKGTGWEQSRKTAAGQPLC